MRWIHSKKRIIRRTYCMWGHTGLMHSGVFPWLWGDHLQMAIHSKWPDPGAWLKRAKFLHPLGAGDLPREETSSVIWPLVIALLEPKVQQYRRLSVKWVFSQCILILQHMLTCHWWRSLSLHCQTIARFELPHVIAYPIPLDTCTVMQPSRWTPLCMANHERPIWGYSVQGRQTSLPLEWPHILSSLFFFKYALSYSETVVTEPVHGQALFLFWMAKLLSANLCSLFRAQ